MANKRKESVKDVAKREVAEMIREALVKAGLEVNTDFAAFGFTKNTLVVSHAATDIQVKLIAPKGTLVKYEAKEEEVEEEVED